MPTVLVVDDEQEILSAVRTILDDENYRVETAGDGAEALELLRRIDPPDLVLTDLMMPRVSGQELLRQVREDPRLRGIPMALMSSVNTPATRETAGWNAILRKPFSLDDLLAMVERLTSKRR